MEIPFVLALCYPCFNFLCLMMFLHLGKALEIQGETVLPRTKLSPKDNNNLSVHMCACSVAQSCPTLCTPMDCSLPGSPVYEIFPSKNTGVGSHFLFQGISPVQVMNPSFWRLLYWQADSLSLHHVGSPIDLPRRALLKCKPNNPKLIAPVTFLSNSHASSQYFPCPKSSQGQVPAH